MPSEATIKQYETCLRKIEKEGLTIDDPATFFAWIQQRGGVSAQKLYLSALKWKYGAEFPDALQQQLTALYLKQNEMDEFRKLMKDVKS